MSAMLLWINCPCVSFRFCSAASSVKLLGQQVLFARGAGEQLRTLAFERRALKSPPLTRDR
jgi:hypothetical protein